MRTFDAVARLNEHRQALGIAEIAAEAAPLAGGWMCFTAPGSWSNQACGLAMDGPISEAELDALVDFYVQRGVEPQLEVCPFAHQSLVAGLAKRGFRLREFENVLVRPVPEGEDLAARMPRTDGLVLERVDASDEAALAVHIDAATSGFRSGPIAPEAFALHARMMRHPRFDGFTATLDGAVIGGAGVETMGEIACLLGASVRPAWRRRGVQTALMVARMLHARQRGASLVVVHSAPGIPTERNAARLGFSVAYTKAVMHRPGPGLAPSS